jgi:hypothetical protein
MEAVRDNTAGLFQPFTRPSNFYEVINEPLKGRCINGALALRDPMVEQRKNDTAS